MMLATLLVFVMLVLSLEAKSLLPCDNRRGDCSCKDVGNTDENNRDDVIIVNFARRSTDRYGRLAEETAAWPDLPNSKFYRFHDYLVLYVATTIPQYKVQPRTLEWGCSNMIIDFLGNTHTVKSCVALVFIYRCKPCQSLGQDAMVAKLLSEGWTPVHCAGYFDLDKNVASHDHRFTMFYHEVATSADYATTLTLNVEQETEFMFWGQIHKDSTMCSHQLSEEDCIAHSADDCYWDDSGAGACRPRMCARASQPNAVGPGYPECQVCVHDENQFLP